jgi:hypothetical protein
MSDMIEKRGYSMKYKVGAPKFKSAIAEIIPGIILGGLMLFFGFRFVARDFFGPKSAVIVNLAQVFGFIIIVISFLVVLPGVSYCQLMWEVDENQLRYTYHDNYLIKIIAFFKHIFKDHHITYQICLNMNQIDYIAVTYAALPRGPFGLIGYDIIFETHMLDGSIFTFESLVTTRREEFNAAVEFMKSQGIKFKDKYSILSELKKDIPISYYLECMERGQKHD